MLGWCKPLPFPEHSTAPGHRRGASGATAAPCERGAVPRQRFDEGNVGSSPWKKAHLSNKDWDFSKKKLEFSKKNAINLI